MSIARALRSGRQTALVPRLTSASVLAGAALVVGTLAWMHYLRAGLVLSHYDAKAHLVVARRVLDNLTPGWQQVGAVWLPLPHLLLLLPVQNDLLYRTGLAGSGLSLLSLAASAWAIATLVQRITGSAAGAAAGVALFTLNPNLLYLSTTPMTEPLLFAVTLLLAVRLYDWSPAGADTLPRGSGGLLWAAAWTRYEAWPIIFTAGALLWLGLAGRAVEWRRILVRAGRFAVWPAAAVVIFLLDSRITVGRWFVSEGFFVPDPMYAGQVWAVLAAILRGARDLSGVVVVAGSLMAVATIVFQGLYRPVRRRAWVALCLWAAAALPAAAFYDGHPFRIRYMTPLVAAAALWCGIGIGLLPRRVQAFGAAALVLAALMEAPPLSQRAPMLVEAQRDRPASIARQAVSECLAQEYRGEKVMASMGSLAHYMQELSWDGFALRDFVHEGNGVIWEAALDTGPAPHVGWMLVEEVAEGGDLLAARIRRDPAFTRGMVRVCDGGGVALYRRAPRVSDRTGRRP